jgi:hypothetical protein
MPKIIVNGITGSIYLPKIFSPVKLLKAIVENINSKVVIK